MAEPLLCEVCSASIPSYKAKGTSVCSVACRFKKKEQKRQQAQTERKEKRDAQAAGKVLFHNCLYFGNADPFIPEKCLCRKRVTIEKAEELIRRGEAIDLETRSPVFAGGAIIQVGKVLRTPRSATVESAHFQRLTEKPKKASKLKDKSVAELEAAVAADRAAKFEEEQLRLHIWGEMRHEFYDKLTVEVPASEFDKRKEEDWAGQVCSGQPSRKCELRVELV